MPPPLYKTSEPIAQIILGAVLAHERQLGIGSLALLLKGPKDKRMFERKLHESPFFGALFYYPKDAIENFAKQLLEMSYLRQAVQQGHFYAVPLLETGEEGRRAFESKAVISLELKRTIKPTVLNETTKATFEFFQKAGNVSLVAQQRNLAESTVWGHLAACIKLGLLSAVDVVEAEKVKLILETQRNIPTRKFKELKEALPDDITYEEIRCALAQEGENDG